MPNPTRSLLGKLKTFARLLASGSLLLVIGVNLTFLKRLVVDLTLKGLSLNQIQEHLHLIYSLDVKKHVLLHWRAEAARKAKQVNHALDRKVAPKIHTMEPDEIFQGSENVILGAVEKKSSYVLALQHAPDRSEASIRSFLRPLARMFANVRVVITDLFRPYVVVVKELFARAKHLLCHVHARRVVMRRLQKLKVALRRQLALVARTTTALARVKARIEVLAGKAGKSAKKARELRDQIATLQQEKRAARPGRTRTVDAKIAAKQERLARMTASNQESATKLKELRSQRDELAKKARETPKALHRAQQNLLQSGRLAKKFYVLLEDHSPAFETRKEKLLALLARSRWPIAKPLAKFLRTHPQLFSLRKARDLAPNYQNTNTMEGVFALFRPLLNSTRLLQTPEGINAYGALFRLYHNTTPPYTGPRNDRSPAERLGVNLHGKSYLDLLFPARGRVTHLLATPKAMQVAPGQWVRGWAGPACRTLAC